MSLSPQRNFQGIEPTDTEELKKQYGEFKKSILEFIDFFHLGANSKFNEAIDEIMKTANQDPKQAQLLCDALIAAVKRTCAPATELEKLGTTLLEQLQIGTLTEEMLELNQVVAFELFNNFRKYIENNPECLERSAYFSEVVSQNLAEFKPKYAMYRMTNISLTLETHIDYTLQIFLNLKFIAGWK